MSAPRKYPEELRERSLRLVAEAMAEDPNLSLNSAVKRIGPRVGVVPDTLRGWAKQVRANEILLAGVQFLRAGGLRRVRPALRRPQGLPASAARERPPSTRPRSPGAPSSG